MVGYNKVTPWRYGWAIYHACDVYVGRSVEVYGEFSKGETEFLCRLLPENGVVVEAGANIGAITIPLARKAGVVFAFEPQRETYYCLCGNIAANSLGHKVRAIHAACGEVAGKIQVPVVNLAQPVNVGGVSLVEGSAAYCDMVPLLALDDCNLPACHLLKVDVEGMELDVLKGAQKLIQAHRPILYVENDRAEKSEALIAYLKGLGYQLFEHRPWLHCEDSFNGVGVDLFPNIVSINLLGFAEGVAPPEWLHGQGLNLV